MERHQMQQNEPLSGVTPASPAQGDRSALMASAIGLTRLNRRALGSSSLLVNSDQEKPAEEEFPLQNQGLGASNSAAALQPPSNLRFVDETGNFEGSSAASRPIASFLTQTSETGRCAPDPPPSRPDLPTARTNPSLSANILMRSIHGRPLAMPSFGRLQPLPGSLHAGRLQSAASDYPAASSPSLRNGATTPQMTGDSLQISGEAEAQRPVLRNSASLLQSAAQFQTAANLYQQHRRGTSNPYRTKIVFNLACLFCGQAVCCRGMKAILLADLKVELYSTDAPPTKRVQLLDLDYATSSCKCQIRDIGCLQCGNVLGYHVTQPCESCLEARNNGHFWMFYSSCVRATERLLEPLESDKGAQVMTWSMISRADKDPLNCMEGNTSASAREYECFCR